MNMRTEEEVEEATSRAGYNFDREATGFHDGIFTALTWVLGGSDEDPTVPES
jgi:hypothetical protein